MREIKVSRLSPYPVDEPTGFAVGFTFSANGRSGYMDTVVSYDETNSDEEAVSIALDRLKDGINSQLAGFETKSPLL